MGWKHTAGFFRQLAVLTRTGMPIGNSLRLAGETAGGAYRKLGLQWSNGCMAGADLASQLTAAGEPPLVCALVRAGESTGRLPELCARIADHFDQITALRSLAISRLIYPMMMLHVALIVPALPPIFLSDASPAWLLLGPGLLWAAIIAAVIIGRIWHESGVLARIALLPGPHYLTQPFLVCNLSLVLAAAMSAGLKARVALELAADAVGNRVIAQRLRTAAQQVDTGVIPDLTSALRQVRMPDSLLAVVATGEQAGTVDRSLDQVAVASRENFQFRALWATKIFTGVIYGAIIIYVAGTIISMASGYVSTIKTMSQEQEQ